MSDVILWIPTHGRYSVDRPAKTYIHQLWVDPGYRLEILPRAMAEREREREREKERKKERKREGERKRERVCVCV